MGKDTTVEAPETPDPNQIAHLDALYNRINTYTPLGNLTYGGENLNEATLTFSPSQQKQFDLQNQITLGGLQQALERQMGLTQLPGLTQGLDFSGLPAIGDVDSEVEQATFDRISNLLNPEFERQESKLRSSLASRGIATDAALADTELGRFSRGRDEALQQAAFQAVSMGRDEALRQRQQGIGEQLQNLQQQQVSRNILFNELQALLGQQQVGLPGTQSFFAPGQTDVTGAYGISTGAAQNTFGVQQQAASQKYGDTANLVGQVAGGGK